MTLTPDMSSGTFSAGQIDLYRKAMAYSHPAYLGEYILDLEPQRFHEEWHDLCEEHQRLVLFAPREHGKSTQLSVIRPIWLLGRQPDLRLAIISSTLLQSRKWLSMIKTNIEFNQRLRRVFPNLKREDRKGWPRGWYSDAIIVQRSSKAAMEEKDYSIQAMGIMGRLLGTRLDGAILDDVLDPHNTMTETGRQKTWDWIFSVLVGSIVEGGFIWCIGTAWHEEDAYHRIERELGKIYRVARYQAGVEPCIWPAQWPEERLQKRREELRELEYNRQMLNIAIGEATQFFPIPKVRRCQELCSDPKTWWHMLRPEDQKQFRWITAGVDLGMSDIRGSHESSIFVLGIDGEQRRHVIHIRSGLWLGTDLLRQIIEVYRLYGVREVLMETNAAQLHVATMMRDNDVLKALGVKTHEISGLRVFGQYTTGNRNDIKWGIRGMGPEFDAEEWRIPRGQPEVEAWVDELRKYTPWDHPGDRLIACWLAFVKMKGRGKELPLRFHSV